MSRQIPSNQQGQGQGAPRPFILQPVQLQKLSQNFKNEMQQAKEVGLTTPEGQDHLRQAQRIKQVLLHYQQQQQKLRAQQQAQQQQGAGANNNNVNNTNNANQQGLNANIANQMQAQVLQQQQAQQQQAAQIRNQAAPNAQQQAQSRAASGTPVVAPRMPIPPQQQNQRINPNSQLPQQQQQQLQQQQQQQPQPQQQPQQQQQQQPASGIQQLQKIKRVLDEFHHKLKAIEETKRSGTLSPDALARLTQQEQMLKQLYDQYTKAAIQMSQQLQARRAANTSAAATSPNTPNSATPQPMMNNIQLQQPPASRNGTPSMVNNVPIPPQQRNISMQGRSQSPSMNQQQQQRIQQQQQQQQQQMLHQALLQQQQPLSAQQAALKVSQMRANQVPNMVPSQQPLPLHLQQSQQHQQQPQAQQHQQAQQLARPQQNVARSNSQIYKAQQGTPNQQQAHLNAKNAQIQQKPQKTPSLTGRSSSPSSSTPVTSANAAARPNAPDATNGAMLQNESDVMKSPVPSIFIPSTLNVKPPAPATLKNGRPSLTGGFSYNAPALTTPAIVKLPPLEIEGGRVIQKRKLKDFIKSVGSDEGDGETTIDGGVEEFLLDLADEFVTSVTQFACRLAKHRKVDSLDVKDIQLHLERNWNIRIPGYASDEICSTRRFTPTQSYNQKISGVEIARSVKKDGNL